MSSSRAQLALAIVATVLVSTCVLPGIGIGRECTTTSDCSSPNVCVLLDETDPASDAVCLPMLELPSPQDCFADEDCPVAGWPVDATCADGRCACSGAKFDATSCPGLDDVIGVHSCRCVPGDLAPDDVCEDDNQCITGFCGAGECTTGFDGEACDADDDCISTNRTCDAGVCV